VTFKAEKLPSKYEKLCIAYTKHYSLQYGAFDLVERPDGSIVFLEINASGQFMWVEEKLGLPISAAIADRLIMIAERRASMLSSVSKTAAKLY
jgi:glutathione synthase/RimK-type ligase-like ATP-grasp enzyme